MHHARQCLRIVLVEAIWSGSCLVPAPLDHSLWLVHCASLQVCLRLVLPVRYPLLRAVGCVLSFQKTFLEDDDQAHDMLYVCILVLSSTLPCGTVVSCPRSSRPRHTSAASRKHRSQRFQRVPALVLYEAAVLRPTSTAVVTPCARSRALGSLSLTVCHSHACACPALAHRCRVLWAPSSQHPCHEAWCPRA